MRRIDFLFIGLLIGFGFGMSQISRGCDPLPVLLYPADEMYAKEGLPIPVLPDDAIALIDGKYIPKADYKVWLYEKIGFTSKLREVFLVNRTLKTQLTRQGIDVDRELAYIKTNFFQFEFRGNLYLDYFEWNAVSARVVEWNVTEPAGYQESIRLRVENSYLLVLYLIQNWDAMHAEIMKEFDVNPAALTITGDSPELNRLIQMNNAYHLYLRYADRIKTSVVKKVLLTENPDMPEHTQEYIDWLYEYYNTVFLTETYIGMLVSNNNAEKKNILPSEDVVAAEFERRLERYREQVTEFNLNLSESSTPLSVSPVYTNFIMGEVRDDLRKSREHRNENPLKPYQITKRFYDEYGYMGQRCQVKEIFKWVRVRRGVTVSPGYAEQYAAEEARVRQELEMVRNAILADGVESFPVYAIDENDGRIRQNNCGYLDSVDVFGEEYAKTLNALSLNEVSPVLTGPWNTLDLFWVAQKNDDKTIFHMISKNLPPATGFDDVAYQQELGDARRALEDLKQQIEAGASIDQLAENHSDSFNRSGVDISLRYQPAYGFRFAKDLMDIPVGGMKILSSQEGLHLVQLVSREVTPFTEEIKQQIIKQYTEELAEQKERYEIITKMFNNVKPYFKTK